MRFAFIVNNYPPRTGGVEVHVRSLAVELTRTGHQALVVTLGNAPGWRFDGNIEVLTLHEHFRIAHVLGFPGWGTRRRLTRLLRQRNIDVVSVHTRFFPMSFLGWRAAKAANIPLVHTEHGSDHVASDSAVIRLASRTVDLTLGRLVLRGANRVLGVSDEVVSFVNRLAGVEAELFPNAIDPGVRVSSPTLDRPQHLVFVGRIVAGKGWREYLHAVSAARAAGYEISGEILGDGAEMTQLREQVKQLELDHIVQVRGRVPQSEVRATLRGATLVNPTVLSEGFQTTLLEAIAEGGRVVTYPVPGALTLQERGAHIRITDSRNASALTTQLFELLQDPGDPTAEGFIHEWCWPARARQYLQLCATVSH